MKPDAGVVIDDCEKINLDLREKQRAVEGKRVKVYRCGAKLFGKVAEDECRDDDETFKRVQPQSSVIDIVYLTLE